MILAVISLQAFAEDGYLKLKANVENVEITVGSQRQTIGTEWSFITLAPGSYRVDASKQYYQTQSKKISVQGGRVVTLVFDFQKPSGFKVEKPKDVSVVKGYGDLTIVTDIPGATVRLNGQSVSGEVAPMTVKELAEGEWRVEATLHGETQSKTINIKAKELSTVRFFFDPKKKAAFVQQQAEEEQAKRKREAELRHKANIDQKRQELLREIENLEKRKPRYPKTASESVTVKPRVRCSVGSTFSVDVRYTDANGNKKTESVRLKRVDKGGPGFVKMASNSSSLRLKSSNTYRESSWSEFLAGHQTGSIRFEIIDVARKNEKIRAEYNAQKKAIQDKIDALKRQADNLK